MKVQRLFHVLVVMSATGCDADDDDGTDKGRRGSGDPPVDAAASSPNDASSDATPGEGDLCFCNMDACCDRSVEPAQLADGFVCCWSTTCP
jgi:hypothetical protein